ncbi:right-handed parallel beta-helix repeat-containing protein [Paeniroseomonas aquatica]|uniref:right-handed parallel beta-helix repeat-containing protein n=1 Tax=Paeniroseomonas aquatica TaxID=373043 RepID=UPI003605B8BD
MSRPAWLALLPLLLAPAAAQQAGPAEGPACLVVAGQRDVVIENRTIGPCGGYGIVVTGSERVTIRNVALRDTGDIAVYILGSRDIEVSGNRVRNALSGIFAQDSTGVRVRCNRLEDMRGPVPRGQFVQFDSVHGGGNAISCNHGRNRPGAGDPEDAISLYKSHGLPDSPIRVEGNVIIGGGPSRSGGGIMLGDAGGSHAVAHRNILVDPGQYGIAVASGEHMAITENRILARRQDFTNVGISVWNQYPTPCGDITVRGNAVSWISRSGAANPSGTPVCGPVQGLGQNRLAASLSPAMAEDLPPDCGCDGAAR